MKKVNKKIFLGLIVSVLFLGRVNAALPNSLGTLTQSGSSVTDQCRGEDSTPQHCYRVSIQKTSMLLDPNDSMSDIVTCTAQIKDPAANAGVECTITNDWDEATRYGVAAIITAAKPFLKHAEVTPQYFAMQLAINQFINNHDGGGRDINESIITSTYMDLYNTYVALGESAYNSYAADSTVTISLSAQSLNFKISGDNYVSDPVTITGASNVDITTNKGTYSRNGNTFTITIPKSQVTSSTTVTVSITGYKSLNQARNYDCTGNYQSVTPIALETVTKSGGKLITGTINPSYSLKIEKFDGNNAALAGAVIEITGPNNYSKTITTTSEPTTITGLEAGEYTITEKSAPDGYIIAEPKTVTLSGATLTQTVTFVDELTTVTISKKDVTNMSELPGATLRVLNSNSENISCTIKRMVSGVEETTDLNDCSWVSGDTDVTILGLKAGTYYLVETVAPAGYVLSTEKVSFTVKNNGTSDPVQMLNGLNKVIISKVSAESGEKVVGAELQIEDEDGNVVELCVDENLNNNTACKWTTRDSNYEIVGMPSGTYYLVETFAPEGYALNTERIKFVVDGSKSIINVEMKNAIKVDVPDTLSTKSALLIAVAMFDIALGIGIITYVKKNKAK